MRADDISPAMRIAAGHLHAPHWPAAVYARALDPESSPPRIALAAELPEGKIAGFLITLLIPPQSELETIAVAKQAQRQGIASGLFKELLAILEDRGITEVMLEVRESNNAARAFYTALLFTEVGRRADYYAEPKEDAILLRRSIP